MNFAPQQSATRTFNRILSVTVFVAMIVHTYFKFQEGTLPELLWGCNVASFIIMVGLWLEVPILVGTGFIWHVSVGEPGAIYGVIKSGHTTFSSILVHFLPPVVAFFSLRRSGLPKLSPYFAFILFVLLVPISHYLTPAQFNINMAHKRFWLLQQHFPGNWDYRFAFSTIMLCIMLIANWGFGKIVGRPKPFEPQTA